MSGTGCNVTLAAAAQAAAALAAAEAELAALREQLRKAEAEGVRLLALSRGSQDELDASVAREQVHRHHNPFTSQYRGRYHYNPRRSPC
jgi:hypothetical protein